MWSVKLTGGKYEGEGRLEVKFNNRWSPVCNSGWDLNDAKVVCHQLGYDLNVTTDIHAITTLTSGGTMWLSYVRCLGSENNLADCSHRTWGYSSCQHAGVQCFNTSSTKGTDNFQMTCSIYKSY